MTPRLLQLSPLGGLSDDDVVVHAELAAEWRDFILPRGSPYRSQWERLHPKRGAAAAVLAGSCAAAAAAAVQTAAAAISTSTSSAASAGRDARAPRDAAAEEALHHGKHGPQLDVQGPFVVVGTTHCSS